MSVPESTRIFRPNPMAATLGAVLFVSLAQAGRTAPRSDLVPPAPAGASEVVLAAPLPEALLAVPGSRQEATAPAHEQQPCAVCGSQASVERLSAAAVLSAARALGERNEAEIARIDELLLAGQLGPYPSRAARRRAQVLARLALSNWYSFLYPYVSDPHRVWATDGAALSAVVSQYCESSVFPAVRLRELRMGCGRVCVRFDLNERTEGWMVMGGRRIRYAVKDVRIRGQRRRVLSFEWASTSLGHTDILLGEHYTFRMARAGAEQTPAGYELYVAYGIQGAWVRRMGLHRPAAFAFWVTPPRSEPPYLPDRPLIGSAIYVPGLRFKLPLFLPDVNLADVRILSLPLPFVDVGYLRPQRMPDWLEFEGQLELADWEGLGEPPELLQRLFPDH